MMILDGIRMLESTRYLAGLTQFLGWAEERISELICNRVLHAGQR